RYGPPEKIIALDVAQRLNSKLRESQLKTVMTRSSDVFVELNDRVAIENAQKNAIFVSIHFNDSRRRGVRGFETYYHSGASFDLANGIQAKLMTIPRSRNRIFVSIHFNDSRRRGVRGFETYYHSGASFDLANGIQAKLMTIPRSRN